MRRTILALLAIGTALALCLAGCGAASSDDGDTTTDFTWYKAQVPSSWDVRFYDGDTARDAQFVTADDDAFSAQVLLVTYQTAEKARSESLSFWPDHKAADDVTIGANTWKVESYDQDDGTAGQTLYLDAPDGTSCIEVVLRGATTDDDDVRSFLEGIEFSEDTADAYERAAEVASSDVNVKK